MSHDFNYFATWTFEDVEDLPDYSSPFDDRPNFVDIEEEA